MTAILVSAGSTVAVLVGLGLVGLALKQRWMGGGPTRAGGRIEVLGRVGLGANQGLALVRVGRRTVLLSSGEGGARTLLELTDADLAAEPEEDGATVRSDLGGPGWPGRGFGLRRLGIWAAFALTTVLSSAALEAQVEGPPSIAGQGTEVSELIQRLPPLSVRLGDETEGIRLTGTVGTVIVLGFLAIAPTLLLLTTSFTRILVVLYLLRQALGTQNTPPGHLLAGLALLLTGVVMAPTLEQVRVSAVDPWLAGEIDEGTMMGRATEPLRAFMFEHVRETDLRTFLDISRAAPPETPADISSSVLVSAFVTSELRAAFEIGFALFLPFVVIDLVVAAILTSMGMFMLPPTMIALPCKLLVFVLMDGWSLVLGALAEGFV